VSVRPPTRQMLALGHDLLARCCAIDFLSERSVVRPHHPDDLTQTSTRPATNTY
jgi:hypothetical protein